MTHPNDPNNIHFEEPLIAVEEQLQELRRRIGEAGLDLERDLEIFERAFRRAQQRIYRNLSAWQKVWIARHPERPRTFQYVEALIEDRVEFHSDRIDGDDPALLGGTGWFEGQPVVYLAQRKGRNTKENLQTNFGMMHPQGYRKARHLMRLAAKFGYPVISFVDTPAAHPGANAEVRGQAMAIAENLFEMAGLPVPLVVVVVGEGGSGGALGVAMGNAVLMMEYAIYCVAPPEACSGILWKDSGEHAPEAAEGLKLTAADLLQLNVVDEIIPEPLGGAHRNPPEAFRNVRRVVRRHLRRLMEMSPTELIEQRYRKYRSIGIFQEGGVLSAAGR